MEKWAFLYTKLPTYQLAKNAGHIRGNTWFLVTEGRNYSVALAKAQRLGKFNYRQLFGSRKIS